MEKTLSIIIPAYNTEKYLENCVNSLINQDVDPNIYEIIIVNDGSTDSTPVIANRLEKEHSNITVLNQKNQGLSATRNNGLKIASGDFIYFLDADDYVVHNCFSTLFNYLDKEECQLLTFGTKTTTELNVFESDTDLDSNYKATPIKGETYISSYRYRNEVWWYMINRKFLKEINLLFEEGRWLEDGIFTLRLLLQTQKLCNLPFDIHRYVRTEDSAMVKKTDAHYRTIIHDMAHSARRFSELIDEVGPTITNANCLDRIKSRKESYSFFLLIRVFKSKMSYKELKEIKSTLKSFNAFPLKAFYKKDYTKPHYYIISKILNTNWTSYLAFKAFRLIKNQ
ncbi:MAG: glycosyltransferase family 2 protein [bacterium]